MKRTDTHRPSVIRPEEYRFVEFEVVKDSVPAWTLMRRQIITEDFARTGGTYSGHRHGGNCAICGSVNAVYTALFHHAPSNTYVRVGQDCADQLDAGIVPSFRAFMREAEGIREAARGKAKAEAWLAERGIGQAWDLYLAGSPKGYEVTVIVDIVGKLVKYGSVSEATERYLVALVAKLPRLGAIAAERAAEKALAADCPEGRVAVAGTVLKVETKESQFGLVTKMAVKAAEGYVVWVTVPSGLGDVAKGDAVKFVASLTPSDNDPKFGFGSRPVAK